MGDRDWARGAILSENICEPEGRYVQDSLAECYRLARTPRKVRISPGACPAHLSEVPGAVRIALERAEVRPIPRTPISVAREAVSIVNIPRTCLGILHVHGICSWRHAQKFPCCRKKAHWCQKPEEVCAPVSLPCVVSGEWQFGLIATPISIKSAAIETF